MSDIKISIINDEISPDLKETIDFLNSTEVKWLELRSLGGINILNLTDNQLLNVKAELDKNNIAVSAICSPIFKWSLENDIKQLEFGFKKDKPESYYIERAIEVAKLFKTNKIRIFSYLKNVSYNASIFANTLQVLDKLAAGNNIYFLLENEPVCNLMHFNDTLELLFKLDAKNIKLLVDVGNIYKIGQEVNLDEFKRASKYCEYYHLKDWRNGRFVALGEGIIPFQSIIDIISKFHKEFSLSLETHTKNKIDVLNSLVYLKKICQKFQ